MLKLDSELDTLKDHVSGKGHDRHMKELFQDDFDSSETKTKLQGKTHAFGVGGAIRPPMLRTRLKRLKHVQRLTKEHNKTQAETYATSRTVETTSGLETVGDMLHEFKENKRSVCSGVAHSGLRWLHRHMQSVHIGLWQKALAQLESHYGHGVAELMKIMKFMLMLNFGLGVLWLFMVIIPRDFETEETFMESLKTVLVSLFVKDEGGTRSLFYDGYTRTSVSVLGLVPLRMDVLYFLAILASVVFSLLVILRTLGLRLTDLAQSGAAGASVGTSLDRDASKDFATMLGAYDMSVCEGGSESAKEMRQEIRKKMETWVVETEESDAIREAHQNIFKRGLHYFRLKLGFLVTVAFLFGYAYTLFLILDQQDEIAALLTPAAPPLLLSILNVMMPVLIKTIVKIEGHFRSTDVLQVCMQRIFIVKLVQLSSIMLSLMELYEEKKEAATLTIEQTTLTTVINNSTTIQSAASLTSTGECVEALFGGIFFRLVLTDAFVFSFLQFIKLRLVTHGVPLLWKWSSTVNHFDRGDPDEDEPDIKNHGYRLQRRIETREIALTMEDQLNNRSLRTKTLLTWWKLMPTSGIAHKHWLNVDLKRGLKEYVDDKVVSENKDRKGWRESADIFVEVLGAHGVTNVQGLVDLNLGPQRLAKLVKDPDRKMDLELQLKAVEIDENVVDELAVEIVANQVRTR
eukprot:SAG11_NODE_1192_length_5564_cov_1.990851_2_plen_688_part_00